MDLKNVVDTHTHSKFSHDSVCEISDMLSAQRSRSVFGFSVTDHFDISDYNGESSFEKIGESVSEAKRLDSPSFRVFSGVEIGAGARNPNVFKMLSKAFDYDIVLGSVHRLLFRGKIMQTSVTDFRTWDERDLYALMHCYYDETLTLLEECEFDVLTHLNYPLRYITVKAGREIDLKEFDEKIDLIFKTVIQKGICLEVNTAKIEHSLTPSVEYIKRYFELGGRKVTLGSDAHVVDNASKGFEDAIAVLKSVGFENAYYFEKRLPKQFRL